MIKSLLKTVAIVICAIVCCAVSCDDREILRFSYIMQFADIRENPTVEMYTDKNTIYLKYLHRTGSITYSTIWGTEYSYNDYFISPSGKFTIFKQLAAKYGDTNYGIYSDFVRSQEWDRYPCSTANTITDINITSTADWDDTHPAGTLLDDVFDITYATFAEYVDSDYDETKLHTVKETRTKTVADISDTDLRLIVCSIGSYKPTPYYTVKSLPTAEKRHTLTIKLLLDDGTTRESTVEAEFP